MKGFCFIILSVFCFYSVIGQTNYKNCKIDSTIVLFNSGSFSFDLTADSTLQNLIRELTEKKATFIKLVGHTDPLGSLEYNRQLSKKRVEAVERFLLDYVDLEISTDYFGETKLLVNSDNRLNRRVEVKYFHSCRNDSINEKFKSKSVIYQKDQNCHIDTSLTQKTYMKNLVGSRSSVVVLDWTRSMYAYGLELLKWFEINEHIANFNEVVIFNDGNGIPTSKKKLGKVGGIYHTALDSITAVVQLMELVAEKGTGGDYPENYIEALVYAQKKFPESDTLILVADNRACIRDYKLLDSLIKPVVVILNEIDSADQIVNYQYVNLIAQVGGRLVFMNQELKNIEFKNNQGYKPIYFKDTVIVLPKFRGNLDYAYEQIKRLKEKQLKTSIPPLLVVNGTDLHKCMNQNIPSTDFKLGCAKCNLYDYEIKTHTVFVEQYTLRQKVAIKWRNRARERFGVNDYKWRKIKCENCNHVDEKEERKRCLQQKRECLTVKKTCKKNKLKAKREVKKYRKAKRKTRRQAFKNFFKKDKNTNQTSRNGGGVQLKNEQ